MAISRKTEQSLLAHDEWTLVQTTHRPEIGTQDEEALRAARKRLRQLHSKERDLAHEKRRIARGKADARGGSFPGTQEHPRRRKQVFAHALRRVNDELGRRAATQSRQRIVDSQRLENQVERQIAKITDALLEDDGPTPLGFGDEIPAFMLIAGKA